MSLSLGKVCIDILLKVDFSYPHAIGSKVIQLPSFKRMKPSITVFVLNMSLSYACMLT